MAMRPRQVEFDLPDVVLADDFGAIRSQQAGIHAVLDGGHHGGRLGGPDAGGEMAADGERPLVKPEHPRTQPRCGRGRAAQRGDDVSALDENVAIERDADGLSGDRRARRLRACWHWPCLDRLDAGGLAGRHDEDIVTHAECGRSPRVRQ